jgi:hypothetical protein
MNRLTLEQLDLHLGFLRSWLHPVFPKSSGTQTITARGREQWRFDSPRTSRFVADLAAVHDPTGWDSQIAFHLTDDS